MANPEIITGNLLVGLDADNYEPFWAILDHSQVGYEAPTSGVFVGDKVVDPLDKTRAGRVAEATDVKGNPFTSQRPGGIAYTTIKWSDGTEESRLSTQLLVPRWPRAAEVRLETADYLTVYGEVEPETIVWEGFVRLLKQKQPRDMPPLKPRIPEQADVDGEKWARWFVRHLPARLEKPFKADAAPSDPHEALDKQG